MLQSKRSSISINGWIPRERPRSTFLNTTAGRTRCASRPTPRETVAYEELVREIYSKRGFAIREPIHHGRWAGREKCHTWQDLILANRGPAS